MGELHGKVGAMYYSRAHIADDDISFGNDNPDIISTAGGSFTAAGFLPDMLITVSGSTVNNDDFTIETGGGSVTAGAITLVAGDTLTTEAAGDDVVIFESPRGTQLLGFRGWSFDDGVDIIDKTDFADGATNIKTKIVALKDWSATCESYWLDDTLYDLTVNATHVTGKYVFRFFVRNAADPTGTTAYYYEGLGIVANEPVNVPADELVARQLNIVGTGALTFVTRTTAWPT